MKLTEILGFTKIQAIEYLERIRWDDKPICPHCKSMEVTALKGVATRQGVYKCKNKNCRKQFTVTVGTIFEGSHIPLNKWIAAFALVCSSKKGISSHQIHRTLEITYKTAWFMVHRIRYALEQSPKSPLLSGRVEVDETYVGGKKRDHRPEPKKTPVIALVQRDGTVRTKVIKCTKASELRKVIEENVDKNSTLITDNYKSYTKLGKEFKGGHKVVSHSTGQYAIGEYSTNTVESYFSLLKRGITGTFHHVSPQHLHRFCHEFNFRWNTRKITDGERLNTCLRISRWEKVGL